MKHRRLISLTLFLIGCYLLSLFRPMLPSVGGFVTSSDGYFLSRLRSRSETNVLFFPVSSLSSASASAAKTFVDFLRLGHFLRATKHCIHTSG